MIQRLSETSFSTFPKIRQTRFLYKKKSMPPANWRKSQRRPILGSQKIIQISRRKETMSSLTMEWITLIIPLETFSRLSLLIKIQVKRWYLIRTLARSNRSHWPTSALLSCQSIITRQVMTLHSSRIWQMRHLSKARAKINCLKRMLASWFNPTSQAISPKIKANPPCL